MKLVVVGLGQCGGRIADEFVRLNGRARSLWGIEIITSAFAVNTDAADLSGLLTIRSDYQHRILIGGDKTSGHGVAKLSELGAEIARKDGDKVIDAVGTTKGFLEADAFLLVAGGAGGTGSGAMPVLAQYLKERYADKHLYSVVVLPFEHEEMTEERAIYNTAVCLKSTYAASEAVFLVDNQRYIRKGLSLRNNVVKINELIVEPFYNLLCAGEEKKAKHIGAKTLDAGDIIETLSGWTAIGYGKSLLPLIRLPFERRRGFREKATETHKGIQAMDEAISELSVQCRLEDSGRALYLISGPAEEMSTYMVKELDEYLRTMAPEAIIRNGDYPKEKGVVDVTVILSQIREMQRVSDYYAKAATVAIKMKSRKEARASERSVTEDASKDIPTLI